jgi:hypothetical protein
MSNLQKCLWVAILATLFLTRVVVADDTPTATFTITQTPSSTATSTVTQTPTITATATRTLTGTVTATGTRTFTVSATPSPVWTNTPGPTAPPTSTRTNTLTPTVTATPTRTLTPNTLEVAASHAGCLFLSATPQAVGTSNRRFAFAFWPNGGEAWCGYSTSTLSRTPGPASGAHYADGQTRDKCQCQDSTLYCIGDPTTQVCWDECGNVTPTSTQTPTATPTATPTNTP